MSIGVHRQPVAADKARQGRWSKSHPKDGSRGESPAVRRYRERMKGLKA